MEVTSLETSKRIWELSGWNHTQYFWVAEPFKDEDYRLMDAQSLRQVNDAMWNTALTSTFAYDLAYLLDKLTEVRTGLTLYHVHSTMNWEAFYAGKSFDYGTDGQHWETQAHSPTEAAGLLAIALFEAGILKKETD